MPPRRAPLGPDTSSFSPANADIARASYRLYAGLTRAADNVAILRFMRTSEFAVRRHHAAAMSHGIAVLLPPEDLPRLERVGRRIGRVRRGRLDRTVRGWSRRAHAARGGARMASRTQAVSALARRRNASRDSDIGP